MPHLATILTSFLGISFIFIPHHRSFSDSRAISLFRALEDACRHAFRPRTLKRILRDIPTFLLFSISALAPLAPAVLALLLPLFPGSPRFTLALGGLALLMLAACCLGLIWLSGLTFAFGGPPTHKRTPFAILIPAYLLTTAAISLAAAAWPALAAIVCRLT